MESIVPDSSVGSLVVADSWGSAGFLTPEGDHDA